MAESATSTKNEMIYEDPVVHDDLFGPAVRGMFWGGFGTLVAAHLAIAIMSLVIWNKFADTIGANGDPTGILSTLTTQQVFVLIDTVGAILFSSAFVVSALVVSRMPQWGRITMLSVAGFLLVGSNAVAAFNLMNLLNLR